MADLTSAPVGLGVKLPFATADEFVTRYRDNVTRGGIYLRAKKTLPPGTMVNLDIKLASGDRLLHGSAVVHFVTGHSGQGPSGIGLRFLNLDEKSNQFLSNILAGQPGAFADSPPIPPGVGPVQYAEQAKTPDDTAVTRVMEVPANLGAMGAIPLPSPSGPSYSAPPPTVQPMGAIPLPSPGGPSSAQSFDSIPLPAPSGHAPAMDPVALPSPGGYAAPTADPFSGMGPASWEAPPPPAPVIAQSARMTPPAAAPASAANIDAALLERLELDPSSPYALLGISPGSSPADAQDAALRLRGQLQLDVGSSDPLVTRLRRVMAIRLEAAVREVEKQSAPVAETPEAAALRAMLQGAPAETYQFASNSGDPAMAALAVAAASSIAAEHRSAEWLAQAKSAAQRAEGAPRLFGEPWALVAHAAHLVGDQGEVEAALAELAKAQPQHPFVARPSAGAAAAPSPLTIGGDEPKKRGMGSIVVTALAMAVIGAGGGIVAAKTLPISIPGLDAAPAVAAAPAEKKPEAKKEEAKKAESKPAETATQAAAVAAAKPAEDAAKATAAKPAEDKAAADAKAAEEAKKVADAKAAEEAKKVADAKAAEDAKVAADAKAAEEARKVADAKAAEEAKKLADAKAAEEAKAAEAAKVAEAAKATEAGKTEVASAKMDPAAENRLLGRAERVIDDGGNCNGLMDELATIATGSDSPARMGKAMILRARCYDSTSRPGQAKAEYRRYLKWFPKGAYVDEARDAG